jgi:hypothetical protein
MVTVVDAPLAHATLAMTSAVQMVPATADTSAFALMSLLQFAFP